MKTMYGILLDPKHFAVHDGPGVRTTFFLKGCPLRCLWCHNPESLRIEPQIAWYAHKCISCGECVPVCPAGAHGIRDGRHWIQYSLCKHCGRCEQVCPASALKLYGRKVSVEEALKIALEDLDFYRESGGGVTLSGGEPLLQIEFVREFLRRLKEAGIHTALDTCCLVPRESLCSVLPVTDLFLVDFKHPDSAVHRKLTGQPNEQILENLRFLSGQGANIEIRIPLVPGCNDSERDLEASGRFLSSLNNVQCVKLLPYHSLARSKYAALGMVDTMPRVESPSDAALHHAAEILKQYGLNARSGRD